MMNGELHFERGLKLDTEQPQQPLRNEYSS